MPDSAQVLFRHGDKPLRFTGRLLGEASVCDEDDTGLYSRVRLFRTAGGSLIWAWDLADCEEPDDDDLQRARALVIDAAASHPLPDPTDPHGPTVARRATPAELAQLAWEKRPGGDARLIEASTRAFHAAAANDAAVGAALFEDVE